MSDDLTRRDAIKLAAAATLAASVDVPDALAAQAGAAAKPSATFFTRAELALVDELSELGGECGHGVLLEVVRSPAAGWPGGVCCGSCCSPSPPSIHGPP